MDDYFIFFNYNKIEDVGGNFMWDEILIGLGIAILILIAIILIRTLLFVDKNDYNKKVPFDVADDNIVYKLGERYDAKRNPC